MDSKLKTLFYLKKPKNYIKGQLPIYLGISVDYPPKKLSTGVSSLSKAWNVKSERIKGADLCFSTETRARQKKKHLFPLIQTARE